MHGLPPGGNIFAGALSGGILPDWGLPGVLAHGFPVSGHLKFCCNRMSVTVRADVLAQQPTTELTKGACICCHHEKGQRPVAAALETASHVSWAVGALHLLLVLVPLALSCATTVSHILQRSLIR